MDMLSGLRVIFFSPVKMVGLGITGSLAYLGILYQHKITLLIPLAYIVYLGYMANSDTKKPPQLPALYKQKELAIENTMEQNTPVKLEKKTTLTKITTETIYFR